MKSILCTLLILAFFSGVFFACSTDDDPKPTEFDLETKIGQMLMIGFRGMEIGPDDVVISDDMNMGAITDEFGLEEAIYRTIAAGVDILIFANNLVYDEHIAMKATDIILDLIADGKISENRIDQSYKRILALKSKLK